MYNWFSLYTSRQMRKSTKIFEYLWWIFIYYLALQYMLNSNVFRHVYICHSPLISSTHRNLVRHCHLRIVVYIHDSLTTRNDPFAFGYRFVKVILNIRLLMWKTRLNGFLKCRKKEREKGAYRNLFLRY